MGLPMRICLALLASHLLLAPAWGQSPGVPFECRRATAPITVDGRGDEPAWQSAQLIDTFRRPWLMGDAQKTKTATTARLLWDDEYLYFLAELTDHDLFADLTQHDDRTWLNDVFEIFFRPDPSKPPYYEFQVNAAGTLLDIYFKQKGTPFDEAKRDGVFKWQAAVTRRGTLDNRTDRDEGWTAEGRIPWSDFQRTGGRPAVGDVWRMALCRYDYTLNQDPETSTCAPLSKPSFHLLEDYAGLKFVGNQTGHLQPALPGKLLAQAYVAGSKVVGSPDPPLPYRPVRAYPQLQLTFPIALDRIPASDQLLIIAQDKSYGPSVVLRVRDHPEVSKVEPALVVPGSGTAYGICFHPRFADNGFLYLGWNGVLDGGPKRTYVTRYTLDHTTFAIDPASALHIISWESGGHNGGDLEFGLDGMLYVSSGDGTSDSDTNLRGQELAELTSKVLRIDVDHPAAGKNYSVPADNPFVHRPGTAPETWAYGLRNPWRLTIDPQAGHLWVGNNGQDLWEQVYFVRKGDNFGWSVYEGSHIFYQNRTLGPEPLTLPAAEHHHSEARSLTGGVVYHGTKLPELTGAYIYGDHSTGRIWGIRHDGTRVTWQKLLTDTTFNITGFGLDRHGELLVADHRGDGQGAYYYLEPAPPETNPAPFPRKLSESGLFRSVKDHQLENGVIAYSVNSPLWSDGAHKERFFAIPATAPRDTPIDLGTKGGWNFPEGTVLIKSFALDRLAGDTAARRWIETRFLTKQGNEWAGYSYRWNDDQTDAELVPAEGLDQEYLVATPASPESSTELRRQSWHFPSRVECLVCHSRAAGFVLGLSTAQMNKTHDYGGTTEHQFTVLSRLGLLKTKPNEPSPAVDPAKYPRLVNPYDEHEPLEARARSYLHANCASCHTNAGGGNAQMELTHTASLKKLNVIDVEPLHHRFGLEQPRLIAPGHPERSVLFHRLSHRGKSSGQMPQMATNLVDAEAVQLFDRWIRALAETPP